MSASATTLPAPTFEAVAPTPTPRPIYPAERIVASSIHLDAKVAESPIVKNEWVVPKFAAGHLQGTAQPLEGGNVVLAGHIQSIASGNVFANIARLRPGNQISLYTKGGTITYQVVKVDTVKNTDLTVVAPSPQERLTLITCTGTWLPLQHDYDERTVVIANRVA
jgi:LPXTG-site transpeptidase (sortase) family protein